MEPRRDHTHQNTLAGILVWTCSDPHAECPSLCLHGVQSACPHARPHAASGGARVVQVAVAGHCHEKGWQVYHSCHLLLSLSTETLALSSPPLYRNTCSVIPLSSSLQKHLLCHLLLSTETLALSSLSPPLYRNTCSVIPLSSSLQKHLLCHPPSPSTETLALSSLSPPLYRNTCSVIPLSSSLQKHLLCHPSLLLYRNTCSVIPLSSSLQKHLLCHPKHLSSSFDEYYFLNETMDQIK